MSDINGDDRWVYPGTMGEATIGMPHIDGALYEADGHAELLPVRSGTVYLATRVHDGDASIANTIDLSPEEAEDLARDLLLCAADARTKRAEE